MKQVLIGLDVQVAVSSNQANVGMKGTIIEDTRHMVTLMTGAGEKKLLKKDNVFLIIKEQKIVHGKELQGRIDERMRK